MFRITLPSLRHTSLDLPPSLSWTRGTGRSFHDDLHLQKRAFGVVGVAADHGLHTVAVRIIEHLRHHRVRLFDDADEEPRKPAIVFRQRPIDILLLCEIAVGDEFLLVEFGAIEGQAEGSPLVGGVMSNARMHTAPLAPRA